ncbi:MAG: hypothetical protein F4056_01950, partial [Chloroflexi bacterium]|nr:hypothetical protein [Chloroflexota bacterium]
VEFVVHGMAAPRAAGTGAAGHEVRRRPGPRSPRAQYRLRPAQAIGAGLARRRAAPAAAATRSRGGRGVRGRWIGFRARPRGGNR